MTKSGWRRDSARHSLAARGVSSSYPHTHRKTPMKSANKKFEYSDAEIKRLQDVKYEEKVGGFSCSSCGFFLRHTSFCKNMNVRANVNANGCCTAWSGQSDFKPGVAPSKSQNDSDDEDYDVPGRRTRHVEPGEYTYEDAAEEEPHRLTKAEWEELKGLIGVMEVSDVFGTRDVTRRDQLERKATEQELLYAWLANGLYGEDFEEAYN